jgi:hypothetical protein
MSILVRPRPRLRSRPSRNRDSAVPIRPGPRSLASSDQSSRVSRPRQRDTSVQVERPRSKADRNVKSAAGHGCSVASSQPWQICWRSTPAKTQPWHPESAAFRTRRSPCARTNAQLYRRRAHFHRFRRDPGSSEPPCLVRRAGPLFFCADTAHLRKRSLPRLRAEGSGNINRNKNFRQHQPHLWLTRQ